MDPRNITLSYRVNQAGGASGSMLSGSLASISVDQQYIRAQAGADIGASLSHPNYLHVLFINSDDSLHDSIHEEFTMSLRRYLGPLEKLLENWKDGSKRGVSFTTASNKLKDVCKAMLDFVRYIHSQDVTFKNVGDLRMDEHFVVRDGVLKLWKLPFTRPADVAARKADYKHVAKFIKTLVSPIVGEGSGSPDLFPYLFTRILQCNNANDADLLVNHVALMTSSEQLVFIQNLINKENYVNKEKKSNWSYERALNSMGNCSGWLDKLDERQCFKSNLTSLCRHHFPKKSDYPSTWNTYAELMRRKTDYNDGGGRLLNMFGKSKTNVNRSLLRMCRNLATHLPEHFNSVSEGLIAAMILLSFGEAIEKFQKGLSDVGILGYFMPRGYDP